MNTPAEPGSSLYYSLLYVDQGLRQKILALRHMGEKLSHIKPVAFEWWHNYLQQHHPALLPALAAFLQDSQTSLYEEEALLQHFYQQTAGSIEKEIALLCGVTDPAILEIAENLGIFTARAIHLRDLRKLIIAGKIYFSGEMLIKHHVNLYAFSQMSLMPDIKNLLSEETQYLKKLFLEASTKLSKPLRKQLSPCYILAKIHYQLLLEIERANFPIFTQSIGLTPLRKWWIAWRRG